MTVISQSCRIIMILYTFAYVGRLHILYQVTDNHKITRQSTQNFYPGILHPYLIWKRKMYISTSKVVVKVYLRVTVSLMHNQGIHVYDGPGMLSDKVNHDNSVMHLSSFQAFIVLFIQKPWNYVQGTHHTEFGVTYFGRKAKALEIYIPKFQILSLPPCTIEKLTTAVILQKSYKQNKLLNKKEENLLHGNLHCVYNIISERGYVNLSITKLTYIGYNFDDLLPRSTFLVQCYQGGVALITSPKSPHFCNNYTSSPTTEGKYLMNIVSDTTNGLVVVVYSFKHYSQVSMEATVTSTPCKGIFFNDSKYT